MLKLRQLIEQDQSDLHALNSNPQVMEYFPNVLSTEQSRAMFEKTVAHYENYGFGYWVVEIDGTFAGLTGLSHSGFDTPMGPHVEIGWRFMPWAWGLGYATSAAREALNRGFDEYGLTEIFSYTTQKNVRSENVMKRLGMLRREECDFDHPNTPDWWGQRHIVYSMTSHERMWT
jgi:RimJ/RimL family protein N-acetyltransferase